MTAFEYTHASINASQVDVVVINWNAGTLLRDCLASVEQFGTPYVASITLIDNGSHDHSMDCTKKFQGVESILAGENLGFAKACNQAARRGRSEFILFLNPDAALYPDSLTEVLHYMNNPENASTGICGVQLIDSKGSISRTCARFPHPLRDISHSLGITSALPALGHHMKEWPHDTSRHVDHLIGAFYFVRRKLFNQIEGFDEQFFLYLEDVDFSLRAAQAGWRSYFLATTRAFHVGGGTSRQVKAKRLFYSLRSRLIYAFKHFGQPSALVVLLSTLLIEPLTRLAYAALRGSITSVRETLTGYSLLLRWLPRWVIKGETR